jgi:hypothetical protein
VILVNVMVILLVVYEWGECSGFECGIFGRLNGRIPGT